MIASPMLGALAKSLSDREAKSRTMMSTRKGKTSRRAGMWQSSKGPGGGGGTEDVAAG